MVQKFANKDASLHHQIVTKAFAWAGAGPAAEAEANDGLTDARRDFVREMGCYIILRWCAEFPEAVASEIATDASVSIGQMMTTAPSSRGGKRLFATGIEAVIQTMAASISWLGLGVPY